MTLSRSTAAALLVVASVATSALLTATPAHAADVNVSVSLGDPSFYGRLDLGGMPRPPLLYTRPVLIAPAPVEVEPVYLRVPPGQARDWRRYCGRYDACGRRVYFVQDTWYRTVYVPRHRGDRGDHRGPPPGHARDRGHGHDDHHDRGRGHGNGNGNGHDRGHGEGHDKH